MGSSADSCDSETTVTSFGENLATPTVPDQPYFNESEEEPRIPLQKGRGVAATAAVERRSENQDIPQGETVQSAGNKQSTCSAGDQVAEVSEMKEGSSPVQPEELLREASAESDVDKSVDCEFVQYTTHHILKSLASIEAKCGEKGSESVPAPPSSVDRVNTALQRAQLKICGLSSQRVGRSLIKSKDLLKKRYLLAKAGYPLRRSQSLPATLLSPVRVVSSVNVRLSPGKETRCSPPSFTYKYTPEEEQTLEKEVIEPDGQSSVKSTIFISPSSASKEEAPQREASPLEECPHQRTPSCSLYVPAPISQSTCSLHSLHSEWQERPLCEHMRTLSTRSVPNIAGATCGAFTSPFGCSYSHRHAAYPSRAGSVNPPSTIEMQLRRVLHDIRNSLQNLSQVCEKSVFFLMFLFSFIDLSTSSFTETLRSIRCERPQLHFLPFLNLPVSALLLYSSLLPQERLHPMPNEVNLSFYNLPGRGEIFPLGVLPLTSAPSSLPWSSCPCY